MIKFIFPWYAPSRFLPFHLMILKIWQVIDETLRVITFSLTVFREAKKDVNLAGQSMQWIFILFRKICL